MPASEVDDGGIMAGDGKRDGGWGYKGFLIGKQTDTLYSQSCILLE